MNKVSDKYLLDLLREIVSVHAGGHCEYPGCKNTECDPHHWFSKKNLSIKYDFNSCLNLCSEHHTAGKVSAHKSPNLFRSIIINCEVRSAEWALESHKKAAQIITVAPEIYREEWKLSCWRS